MSENETIIYMVGGAVLLIGAAFLIQKYMPADSKETKEEKEQQKMKDTATTDVLVKQQDALVKQFANTNNEVSADAVVGNSNENDQSNDQSKQSKQS